MANGVSFNASGGDGDIDVVGAGGVDELAFYENDGSQNFSVNTINESSLEALTVTTADLDGDGDLDVLTGVGVNHKIAWYETSIIGGITCSYDFDNDGTFELTNVRDPNVTVPASYLTTAGTLTVRGAVNDPDGGSTEYTIEILGEVLVEPAETIALSLTNFTVVGETGSTNPTATLTG